MSRANNFVERMQAGKDAAAHARHRGRATGGKARLHAPATRLTGFALGYAEVKCKWQGRQLDIMEDYRWTVYPERHDGME